MNRLSLIALSIVLLVSPAGATSSLLLGSSGPDIFTIDPSTGQRTFLAGTGLDSGVNFQFTVDSANHTAYRLGTRSGVLSISSVNLVTGTSQLVPISDYPVLQTYNGSLLGSWGTEIDVINPVTGQRTFLAGTGLDSGVNFQFTVDSANHTAYLLGTRSGVLGISAVDLLNGTSNLLPVSDYPVLAVYTVPEPGIATLALFALVVLVGSRPARRR